MTSFGANTLAILAAILGLGFMILAHEWGHFIVAKFCGVRVDVFSIGYGSRVFGWRRGETDYRISALPFGGYVRMAGENPSEERSGAPEEFLSRPRGQRFLIAIAGPAMNFVVAIILMTGLFLVGVAEPAFMSQPVEVAGVLPESPAAEAGIQAGDRIVKINGVKIPRWEDATFEIAVSQPGKPILVEIHRGGQTIAASVNVASMAGPRDEFAVLGYPSEQVVVGIVGPGSPAERSGLKTGDRVVAVDGEAIQNAIQLSTTIQASKGNGVTLQVLRQGQPVTIVVRPEFGDPGDGLKRWQIGISFRPPTVQQPHSLSSAVHRAVSFNIRIGRQIFDVLAGLFNGRVKLKQLEGPVGIMRESGQAAKRGVLDFINFMAFISLNLGILNLLPIPILDGGHVLMLGIESVMRRDLSLAVKERFVQVGLVFLLAIFAFVMYYDVLRLLPNH
jgi:regulator of sigma E protease